MRPCSFVQALVLRVLACGALLLAHAEAEITNTVRWLDCDNRWAPLADFLREILAQRVGAPPPAEQLFDNATTSQPQEEPPEDFLLNREVLRERLQRLTHHGHRAHNHYVPENLDAFENYVEYLVTENLPKVCAGPCHSSTDLKWGQVLSLFDAHCPIHSRKNLDRYLLHGHYKGVVLTTSSESDKVKDGEEEPLCLFGLIQALLVDAILKWSGQENENGHENGRGRGFQHAFRNVYVAFLLYGYANCFEWSQSSRRWGGLVTFSDVLKNLNAPAADGFVVQTNLAGYVGEEGASRSTSSAEGASGTTCGPAGSPELDFYWGRLRSSSPRRMRAVSKHGNSSSTGNKAAEGGGPEEQAQEVVAVAEASCPTNEQTLKEVDGEVDWSSWFPRYVSDVLVSGAHDHGQDHVVRIFQIDTHTACAGEAKRMLSEFEGPSVARFEWHGYSLARNICHNFDLCPPVEKEPVRDALAELLEQNRRGELTFLAAKKEIRQLLAEHVPMVFRGTPAAVSGSAPATDSLADPEAAAGVPLRRTQNFVLCTQPVSFCRFFLDMNLLVYIGLPLMWMLPGNDESIFQEEKEHHITASTGRDGWGAAFRRLIEFGTSDQHHQKAIVFANSLFAQETFRYQFRYGAPETVPLVPMLGLHVLDGFDFSKLWKGNEGGSSGTKLVVGRSGMNGYLLEWSVVGGGMGSDSEEKNAPRAGLELQLLEDWLLAQKNEKSAAAASSEAAPAPPPRTSRWTEIRTPHFPYQKLVETFAAAVIFPYDAAIFLFHELYLLCIPLFVPKDIFRFMQGPLTHPDMEWRASAGLGADEESREDVFLHSPFQSAKIEFQRPLELDKALYWAKYTNFHFFPHVVYWRSVADIAEQMMSPHRDAFLQKTRRQMKQFNGRHVAMVRESWQTIFNRIVQE